MQSIQITNNNIDEVFSFLQQLNVNTLYYTLGKECDIPLYIISKTLKHNRSGHNSFRAHVGDWLVAENNKLRKLSNNKYRKEYVRKLKQTIRLGDSETLEECTIKYMKYKEQLKENKLKANLSPILGIESAWYFEVYI